MGIRASQQDRERIRGLPAYRRFVWGFRLALLGPVLLMSAALLAGFGVRGIALGIAIALALGTEGIGVVLGWLSIFPLMRHQRAIFTRSGMNRLDRSTAMRSMVLRDVVGMRG